MASSFFCCIIISVKAMSRDQPDSGLMVGSPLGMAADRFRLRR
jgi:hypothetical protein